MKCWVISAHYITSLLWIISTNHTAKYIIKLCYTETKDFLLCWKTKRNFWMKCTSPCSYNKWILRLYHKNTIKLINAIHMIHAVCCNSFEAIWQLCMWNRLIWKFHVKKQPVTFFKFSSFVLLKEKKVKKMIIMT